MVEDIQIIGNIVESGKDYGIDVTGNNLEVSSNWTKGNRYGFRVSGENNYGDSNFAEDGFQDTSMNSTVTLSSSPPSLLPFDVGISW